MTRARAMEMLRERSWSITKTACANGYDFQAFKDHLVRLGFDIEELKRLNRGTRLFGRASPNYGKKRVANNHEVLFVEPLIGEVPVYDLTVEDAHNFIAGELCVHNCKAPNLMNLPRYVKGKDGKVDLTDRIREIYIAERGSVFVYFDLSQAEMRFAAYLSGDAAFIAACKGDVHAGNAKHLFPEAAAQGWLDGKEAKEGRGKRFRDIAKNSGFAVTYMAEPITVHVKLLEKGFDEVQFQDVCKMVDNIRLAYKGYFEYVEHNVALCRRQGYLRTAILGRIRRLGRWPRPTEVANFPIQSGIADLMNARLIKMEPKLPKHARLVAQVHDAAIFEVRKSAVKEMEDLVRETWARPVRLPATGTEFPMPIDFKVAERWSEL